METKQQAQQYFATSNIPSVPFSLAGQSMWARVHDIYDGDTLKLVLHVFGFHYIFSCRVMGIDTAEMKSGVAENKARAQRARDRLIQLVGGPTQEWKTKKQIKQYFADNTHVLWVECLEQDKYGRLLVCLRSAPREDSLADVLVREGLAYKYGGGTKLTEEEQSAL